MTPPDHLDLDLDRPSGGSPTPTEPEPPPDRRILLVGAAVLLACLSVALWYWWAGSGDDPSVAVGQRTTEGDLAEPTSPLGDGEALDLPPLGELDPVVRTLLAALSARPELARLLATDGLVRRFVVSVDGMARGATPAGQITVLRPDGNFSVESQSGQSPIDPRSFARYDGLAATVDDLQPGDLARLYGQLKPRLDEAHAELGGGETFDAAMERALVSLLSVSPDLARGQVQPAKGIAYAWADASTENLSSAQKHLLRMGPVNARRVQAKLRAFALALGIPAERLPGPP